MVAVVVEAEGYFHWVVVAEQAEQYSTGKVEVEVVEEHY